MAKFNSAWLISKRQFRSLTGVEADTFGKLVARLRPHWRERIEAPKNRSRRPWGVDGVEDHLCVSLRVGAVIGECLCHERVCVWDMDVWMHVISTYWSV